MKRPELLRQSKGRSWIGVPRLSLWRLLLRRWWLPWFQSPVLGGVVGPAVAAFHAQHMEGHRAVSLAVIADDLDSGILVLAGHGRLRDLFVHILPAALHVPGRAHAEGAAVRSRFKHVFKTSFVQKMPTGKNVSPYSGGVNVLHTHRAVLSWDIFNTLVVSLQIANQAQIALGTMEVLFSWSNPTNPTRQTVVLLLILVKQVADVTVIITKFYVTPLAGLLRLLDAVTQWAFNLLDLEAIHLMVFLSIMAQSTHIELPTAWGF